MSIPNRTGVPEHTSQSEQSVLNYSFDELFKILTVALAAYNPATNSIDRLKVDPTGSLLASMSETAYATRIDDTATPITYIGRATPGSDPTTAVWQIQRVDETTGTIITWADGDANFNNVWSDRTSLTYV
jgi:hypothetical protein